MRKTILPSRPAGFEESFKVPYTNEFILLSFEGRHLPFEVVYELDGKRPSYAPPAPGGSGACEHGFFQRLKTKLTSPY